MSTNYRRHVKIRAKSTSNIDEVYPDRTILNSRRLSKISDTNNSKSFLRILNVNLKLLLGFGIFASAITTFFIYRLVNFSEQPPMHRVVTPFPAPKLMDLPMFQGKHKESLYWGTYRPHVYFGVRARTPQSLVAGLMWIGAKDGRYSMRHVCQNPDELRTYGWMSHNGRDYGHQIGGEGALREGPYWLSKANFSSISKISEICSLQPWKK